MTGCKQKARIPVQKRSVETKQKIIKAAEELFTENGYHNTNALEIANRADVATGSFYHYFNNKKEVFIEVIRHFYADVAEKVINSTKAGIIEKENLKDKELIRFIINTFHHAHEINPSLLREFNAMVLLDKEIEAINREEERKAIALMTVMFREFKFHTRVKDIGAAMEIIFHLCDETIHRIIIYGADVNRERLLAELEDMVCRYLLAE